VRLIQSLPYAAAVLVSLVNALEVPGGWIGEAGAATPAAVEPAAAPALLQLVHSRDELVIASPGLPDDEALLEERA
jgi:hypothetical protein